ncbi:MAG: patatin-like phospholipase family protein [Bacteroidetes bacterium]|nr:patatin-like phospholipase family protein [Bacteroidota bacterium]
MAEIKKINLALQGGGAHGAYTWGVIDRLLDDSKIEIDAICGTSAGAVNALCTLYGLNKGGKNLAKHLLVKFWHKVSEVGKLSGFQSSWFDKIISPGNLNFSPTYKYFNLISEILSPKQFNPAGYNPLEKILNELIDFNELQNFNHLKLYVCATNVKTCKLKIFYVGEINSKTILASTCLPYLFDAVEINNNYYWDGAYMGNPPLSPLIKNSANDILLIKVNPFEVTKMPLSVEEIKDRINEISFNSSLLKEIEQIELINTIVENGTNLNGKLKKINLHCLSEDQSFADLNTSSKLNTSWDFLMHLKNKGYEACANWIEENYTHIEKKSTFTL